MNEIFSAIAAFLNRLPAGRARIVGVNGVDTSGKTTFCRALARHLAARGAGVTILHLDDFHNPREVRSRGPDPVTAYVDNAFNLDLLESTILAPLHRGESVDAKLTLLDLDTDAFTVEQHYAIAPGELLVVEGVLLYRPPIDCYFDCRIFLDVSFEEVLRRAEVRDVPRYGPAFLERYRTKYIPIQQRYLREHRPRERSHFVVDNNDYLRPSLSANF